MTAPESIRRSHEAEAPVPRASAESWPAFGPIVRADFLGCRLDRTKTKWALSAGSAHLESRTALPLEAVAQRELDDAPAELVVVGQLRPKLGRSARRS